jgi:hypothetical protein
VSGLSNPESQAYLFAVLESDLMPQVDVISWHAFYGDSPEHGSDYYYGYPSLVQRIREVATAHGFKGEFEADEIQWRSESEPDYDHPAYGDPAYAKYWARGILMNLGMDVVAGNLRVTLADWPTAYRMIHNLTSVMAGNSPVSLRATIDTVAAPVVSYGFSLANGDSLLAIWVDGVATDADCPGTPATITFPGQAGRSAAAIDVLRGLQQPLLSSIKRQDLVVRDLLLGDSPVLIRLSSAP